MMILEFYLLCYCLLTLFRRTDCMTTRQDMHNLHSKLLTNYDRDLSPNSNQTDPVTLFVSFNLYSLKEFDDVNGKLAILGSFSIEWNDDRMMWDPKQHGNITNVFLTETKVWVPFVVIGKPYNEVKKIGFDFIQVQYEYTGNAYWEVTDLYEISCMANVAYYPSDRQICEIFFIPLGYSSGFFNLRLPLDAMSQINFTENGNWKVHSSQTSVEYIADGRELIKMTLKFERRPLFIVLNLLLPISVICVLNVFIFILPPEPGERTAFGTTILLSLAVFLSLVSDKLPNTSEPHIPRITVYLLFQLACSSITVAMAIFGLRIYNIEADRQIPHWILQLTACCSRKIQVNGMKRNSTTTVEDNSNGNEKHFNRHTETGYYIYTGIQGTPKENRNWGIKNSEKRHKRDNSFSRTDQANEHMGEKTVLTVTWNHVAQWYDKCCLVAFIFINVCVFLFEIFDLVSYLNSEF